MPHPRSDELSRLADDGDAGGVLSIVTLDEIAQHWCDWTAAAMARHRDNPSDGDAEPGSEWWPFSFMYECLPKVPHLHRELFVKLVQRAPSDDVLAAIGAGPFEDWIQEFSRNEMEWIEHHAGSSGSFRAALRNMRLPRNLSDETRIRFNRAAGFPPDRWLKYDP